MIDVRNVISLVSTMSDHKKQINQINQIPFSIAQASYLSNLS